MREQILGSGGRADRLIAGFRVRARSPRLLVLLLAVCAIFVGPPVDSAMAQDWPTPTPIPGNRPAQAPIFPPGPWGACLVGCPREAVDPWELETIYFCGSPCVALAMAGYDCGALELLDWLEEHAWTLCPEEAYPGCCNEGLPCAGELLPPCCVEEACKYLVARCKCEDLATFHPSPPASSSCDLNDDDIVDCTDLDELLEGLTASEDCPESVEWILDVTCCFLSKIQLECDTEWTPDGMGETVCTDIRECVESRIGRPLRAEELQQLMDCYGGDIADCGCCKEASGGTDYFNCDETFVCDRNGDGETDCEDLKQLLEESKLVCNDGEDLTDEEKLDIACKFIEQCAPPFEEDCEIFLAMVIDCLEEELCRSLTEEEITALAACTETCDPTDCCTEVGGWSCGDSFLCDRANCDGVIDCDDIVAYIAESEAGCNGGVPYDREEPEDREKLINLICEFFLNCGADAGPDICADLKECLAGILGGSMSPEEEEALAICTGCGELCEPNEGAGNGKLGEGDAGCDGQGARAAGPGGVDPAHGDVERSETDLVIAAAGPSLVLGRQYTSDPDFESGCQNPEGWTSSALAFVDSSQAGTLRIAGNALGTIAVDISVGGGPWPLPGPTSRVLSQASATMGAGSVDVWRITDPGRTSTDYYRTSGSTDPELAALDGLVPRTQDPYGNVHNYDYALYGIANPVPRLRRILVNGTPDSLSLGSPPDALVEFAWIQMGEDKGRLGRTDVFRFNGEQKVLVQRVEYTYFDGSVHHPDVGSGGDLVQVVVSERIDPVVGAGGGVPVGVEAWRRHVTQYRYHGGDGASAGVTGRYPAWAGGAHQIKLVIEPEQFEFLAQRLAATEQLASSTPILHDVDYFTAQVLDMADGELVWANDADSDGEVDASEEAPLVDFATMVAATYETSGEKRVLTLSSTSGGGCGSCGVAGTQGSLLAYTYIDRDSDPSVAETVKVEEFLRNLAGTTPVFETTPYRIFWLEYDRPAGTGGVPYLRSSAVQEPGGTNRSWVTRYQHDPSTRTLLAEYTPAVVSGYTPGTDTTAPIYTIATSGLVRVYGWTADNRLARRELSDGQPTFSGSDCTDCVLVEEWIYGDGTGDTREHLIAEMRRYRKDPSATGFDSSTDVETTKFSYAFHGGTGDDVAWTRTEVEAEREAENGPGSPAWYASYEMFDERGDNVWSVAADGAITEREFEAGNAGHLVRIVRNSPNTMPSTIEGLGTTGFGRNADGGALETRFVRDLLGRIRETIQPGDVSTCTLRNAFGHPDRPGIRYYTEVTLPAVVDGAIGQYAGPATAAWYTAGGQSFATSGYRPGIGGYQFAPSAIGQAGYPILVSGYTLAEELSRRIVRHDVAGQVKVVIEWNALTGPANDASKLDGPNNGVHVTLFGQDRLGRPHWTINANGTAERTSYDLLDRVVAAEIGLADTNDWVPDDSSMKFVARHYYDSGGTATTGVGNGNLTRIDQVVDEVASVEVVRTTVLKYDWRDRRYSTVNPLPPHDWTEFDNLDRAIAHATFTAEPTAIDAPLNSGADVRGRYSETSYSQRGLVYRQAIATNPKSSSPSFIESHTWFDQVGRSVGAWGPNGPMQKMSYDGLGRPKVVYLTDRRNDPMPGASGNFAAVFNLSTHASNVADDVVLEQSSTRYVAGRGVMDLSTRRVRTHDATTSDLGALDSGGYPSSKVITSYAGNWYDSANRPIRQAQFGTNSAGFQSGGSAPSIVQSSPPSSNAADATRLVTETRYDSRGLVESVTDPMGRITRFHYDALGRRIMVIENFDPANPVAFVWEGPLNQVADVLTRRWKIASGLDIDHPDRNRATSFVYDGVGNVVRQAAYLVELESDLGEPPTVTPQVRMQETAYLYDSSRRFNGEIESNDLLAEIHYPDTERQMLGPPTKAQPVRFEYNRQGEVVEMWDANVTRHAYTRDDLGRVTLDKATVATSMPGFQVDDFVDAIGSEFDALGRLRTSRSYTEHGTGGEAVVNAVQFDYDDLWQVASATQQPDGDLSGGSASVGIAYDIQPVATGNRSRRTVLTYPDGWELETDYGSSGSVNDRISRVGSLIEEGTSNGYVDYSYVGVGLPVIAHYRIPNVRLTRFHASNGTTTTGQYPGFDRYGRIARQMWVDGAFGAHGSLGTVPNRPPIVETAYLYDNASSRTGAFDARPGSQLPLSQSYSYDGLHRLSEATRGVWNGSLTSPSVPQNRNSQAWSLDPLGNWLEVATDLDGTGGFHVDEIETRDFVDASASPQSNRVNELYARTLAADAGGDELALTYDFAGNILRQELTNDGTDTTALRYTHDAWNRLVKVQFEDDEENLHPRGEYEYTGLNWRTVARIDSDTTNSTHALDELRMMYYSHEWRLVEIRVDANYQSAPGIDSHIQHVWGERYIDDIIATRHDPDPAEEDGYEVVQFHVTDAQFSTVAMLSSTAAVLERVTYSAYGVARHHWLGDVDGDGDVDSADVALVNAAIGESIGDAGYRAEFDLNRDGSITLADRGLMSLAAALPEGVLSSAAVGNRIGYCGYVFAPETRTYLVRHRWYLPPLGRWGQRDPLGYADGMSLYEYVGTAPISATDPLGLQETEFRHIAFIPYEYLLDPIDPDVAYGGDGGPNNWSYSRDRFRMRHTVKVLLDDVPCDAVPNDIVFQKRETGVTVRYGRLRVFDDLRLPNVMIGRRWFEEQARAQEDPLRAMRIEVSGLRLGQDGRRCCVCAIHVTMIGRGKNVVGPILSPYIDFRNTLTFSRSSCRMPGVWRMSGTHDGFPSHLFFVNQHLIHAYSAVGRSPFKLFGDSDQRWGPIFMRRW